MRTDRTRFRSLMLLCALLLAAAQAFAAPTRYALLVGIGKYPTLPADKQLQGPANDVRELRETLTRNWGFADENIRALVDARATRGAIVNELKMLAGTARSGDVVLLYFSGHGTSAADPGNALVKQDLSDTGAFFPFDADVRNGQRALDTLLIGRRDLRPHLSALDDRGVSVYVIADACFSGSLVRSARIGIPVRQASIAGGIRLPPRRQPEAGQGRAIVSEDELESPYRNILFLSAVGSGEPAIDVTDRFLSVYPTLSGEPQGAFTDALLRVLAGRVPADLDRDSRLSFSELARATEAQLQSLRIPYLPRTIPGSRAPGYAGAQRGVFSSNALPQAAAASVVRAPQPGEARGALRLRLARGLPPGLANELRALRDERIELVEAGADAVVSVSAGRAHVCDGAGDATTEFGRYDDNDASQRARVVASVRARAVYHDLLQRARGQASFGLELDLADSNRTAIEECDLATQKAIGAGRGNAEQKTRCLVDVGARAEKPGSLLVLNLDPAGHFFRVWPTRTEIASQSYRIAAGQSRPVLSTFVDRRDEVQGSERLLALVLPEGHDPADLALFEQPVAAERAGSLIEGVLQRAGRHLAVADLELPVIPLGARQRPGMGACLQDL